MPHMLLIHEPIGQRATRSEPEGRAVYDRMLRWGEDLRSRGLLLGAESLASQDKAVRVTVPAGKARIVDGPFAEAKEMVGGFFLMSIPGKKRSHWRSSARRRSGRRWRCAGWRRALTDSSLHTNLGSGLRRNDGS